MILLNVNGKNYRVEAAEDTPLLWVIRDHLGLTGTKFGCGISRCGACTVHVDGEAVRSCITPVSTLAGKKVITIEGLSVDGRHPVQQAWIDDEVPQCGYCHSGQIMSAAALLFKIPKPADADIDKAMSGNLCRCGTYQRIRRAIHRAAGMMEREGSGKKAIAESIPSFVFNPFVRIGQDERVTILVNKSEMGQGVYTALAMLVAEELECDWARVRVEPAPVDPVYNHTAFGIQMTGGSTSVLSEWDRLRQIGAAVRERLISAAAEAWKIDKSLCRAQNGVVIQSNGEMLTYGQLAEKAARLPMPKKVQLKDPASFKLIGRPIQRLDTPAKTDGTALFGIDVKIPDLLTALIARPPVFGGKVKDWDIEKAKAVTGVKKVVKIEAGVAVVGVDFRSAALGRKALEINWEEGPLASLSTVGIREQYARLAKTSGVTARKEGDPEKAMAAAARQIQAEYEVPFLAHAPMEPLNCCVDLRPHHLEIWTGTQFQTVDRDAAARVAGLQPEEVKIHTTFLGGGFGRRANPQSDFVVEAVQVAMAVKKPVQVVWTREDDIKGGYYRPLWFDRIAAGLDSGGNLIAWQHTIVGQSVLKGTLFGRGMIKSGIDVTSVEGAEDIPYEIPNIVVGLHSPDLGVPVQWWRSVGQSHTAFVVESFLDEIAHSLGKDPYEFRRGLLNRHPRHLGVLELAAQKADWGKKPASARARGIALHESFGSFIAQVAEVSVTPAGQVRIHKVVCAIDCGRVVNPDTIKAQMEGGIVFGLSAALHGAITFKKGRVEQGNFNDYRLLTMEEMPVIEVHIVPSNEAPGGVGEPGVPPIAPAVGNAVFAATGKRIRRLPINPGDLKKI
ncbi:MAG: molybdopterin-dependent oxidoreductase [Deltaproteobacteria bacterium]|nr:molybdopterin-dependent oxidoreductase [Deltaproteobacteria bacterium]